MLTLNVFIIALCVAIVQGHKQETSLVQFKHAWPVKVTISQQEGAASIWRALINDLCELLPLLILCK